MGHDLVNINSFEAVPNDDDQSKVIACDIKNCVRCSVISTVKVFVQVVEISKIRVFNHGVPLAQHAFSIRMLEPELAKHLDGDHMHGQLYQIDIFSSMNRIIPRHITRI